MNAKKCKRQMKDSRRDQTQLTLFIYSFFNESFIYEYKYFISIGILKKYRSWTRIVYHN